MFEKLRAVGHRPPVLVNVDLVGGIWADASGLGFLSRHIEGVISTHRHVIELAKEKGLFTVQRLFAINSGAVERGVRLVRRAKPHCVEVLPALAYPEILERPVLAGGLLKTQEDVSAILAAGATRVSTSAQGRWRSRQEERCVKLDTDFRSA